MRTSIFAQSIINMRHGNHRDTNDHRSSFMRMHFCASKVQTLFFIMKIPPHCSLPTKLGVFSTKPFACVFRSYLVRMTNITNIQTRTNAYIKHFIIACIFTRCMHACAYVVALRRKQKPLMCLRSRNELSMSSSERNVHKKKPNRMHTKQPTHHHLTKRTHAWGGLPERVHVRP